MDSGQAAFSLFAILWTLAALFHQIHRSDLVSSPLTLGISISAMLVWGKPSRAWRLFGFCALHATLYVQHAPNAGNHEFFAFCIDCTILVIIGTSAFRNGGDKSDSTTRTFDSIFPTLRAAAIILYFFAVLHKLNTCYLSPQSCGGTLLWNDAAQNIITAKAVARLPIEEDWFRYSSIYASLIVETLIPILLMNRRSAWVACLIGIFFHFLLGFLYFWHFTPLLYALYLLFLPQNFFAKTAQLAQDRIPPKWAARLVWTLTVVLLLLYVAKDHSGMLRWELGSFSRQARNSWHFGLSIRTLFGWLSFIVFSFALPYFIVRFGRDNSPPVASRHFSLVGIGLSIVLLLNGFSPYLGIKTHSSFAMFSSLSVTGGQSNHLFMPVWPLTHHSIDIATPTGPEFTSHQRELRWKSDKALVFFELRKRVSELKRKGTTNIRLSYLRNGERFDFSQAENDPELSKPVNWFERKFRTFRPIPLDGCDCHY